MTDSEGRILVAERPDGKHLAGTWEFPGGKLEVGEDAATTLARELHEETGVTVRASEPLLMLSHQYPEKTVRLMIRAVTDWTGRATGREGQALRWIERGELADLDMPAGNRTIARILELSPYLAISPDPGEFTDLDAFLADWERRARCGGLLQLRGRDMDESQLGELAARCGQVARARGARWLLNGPPELARAVGADGVHLPGWRLKRIAERPLDSRFIVSAACHDMEDIHHAGSLEADFVTFSPVRETASHPKARGIGFDGLERICLQSPLPVYALGGIEPDDLSRARESGAFGVAGIRAFA